MGLGSFETDGPRTYTEESSKQTTFSGRIVDNFEEEWGMPSVEAEEDNEFVAERIKEADQVSDVLDMFHWIEHTFVTRCAQLVDAGDLEIEEVPEVNHPDYNEHEIEFYINNYTEHRTLDRSKSSGNSGSDGKNSSSSGGGALSSFMS